MILMKTLLKRELPYGWDMIPFLDTETRRYVNRTSHIIIDEHVGPDPFEQDILTVHLTIRSRVAKPNWQTIEEARDIFIGTAMDGKASKHQLFFDSQIDTHAIDLWWFYKTTVVQEYIASAWEGTRVNG